MNSNSNGRRLAARAVRNAAARRERAQTTRCQSGRCYASQAAPPPKMMSSNLFMAFNRERLYAYRGKMQAGAISRTFLAATSSGGDDDREEPTKPTLPSVEQLPKRKSAPASAAESISDDTFLDRALRKKPDQEWDAVVYSVDRLRYPNNRRRDNAQYYHYMEVIYDDFAHDSTSTSRRGASQKASDVVPWLEVLPNVETTEYLLKAATGTWRLEQWEQAEELLLLWWTSQHSMRSVVLQFALTLRILQEKKYVEQNDIDTAYKGEWLTSTALNRVIATWKHVYLGGGQFTAALTDCHLKPADLLEKVLNVYHGEFGMELSEKTLRMILEAEVSTLHPGQRPDLANIALEKIIGLWVSDGFESCAPKAKFFNLVAFAWVKADRGQETVDEVSAVLQRMSELHVRWNKISYAHAIQALVQRHSKEAAKEAASLLKQMCHDFIQGNARAKPDPYLFAMAISAWANSGSPEAGPRAEQLYEQMILLREKNHLSDDNKSDSFVVNSVLRCWGNAKTPSAAAQAEDFWRSTGVQANSVTYGTLTRLYAQVGRVKDVERLVEEMEIAIVASESNENSEATSIEPPNFYAYTALLSAYAKSDLRDKVERAEAVLRRMKQKAGPKPNREVYNAFLSVLANAKESLSVKRAEELLLEMKTLGAEDKDVLPDFISYSAVMNVWAKAGQAEQAAAVLRDMLVDFMSGNENAKPDLQSFNTILAAYAKSKKENAPKQAEMLLQDMKKLADNGPLEIKPDVYTFNSVIACLANSKTKREEAALRAENLLHDMKRRWKAGDRFAQPSTHTYNSVMNAFARAGEPIRADNIFREMLEDYKNGNEHAKPETSTFNTLIKAWGFSKRPDAMERSEDIIRRMVGYKQSLNLDVAPDVRTYTALVMCYGLSKTPGAPQRAEWVVRYMDKLHKSGHLPEGPNKKTFITLRKAWTGSNEPDKDQRAAAIQREIAARFGDDGEH